MSRFSAFAFVAAVTFASTALADIPPNRKPVRPPSVEEPRPAPSHIELLIRIDPAAKEARLEIPSKLLSRTVADAGAEPGGISTTRTVAAGLALSAGMASIVLLRRRRGAGLAGAAAACVAAFAVVSAVEANSAPPPARRPEPATVTSESLTATSILRELGGDLGRNVSGRVKVEISNTANIVTLVLPKGGGKESPAPATKSAPAAAAPPGAAPQ